ncbi:uncharacterized protein LTR77_004197 [Saxophila tyrrhenica]|uniref:Uncharacterized protein n=1 Tax=Saxophila tyrrhenica TaxID=1690608 RepID=A0AAV9PG26_9PEZI|nr:hypothetical protein LTR77_004197 [Saxophila tyrrhenica]
MERSKGNSSSLSLNSHSKRSSTNLSNLRLAPLSSQYTPKTKDVRFGTEDAGDGPFQRSHSSYLQGKSAPASPGILSRSSSRRQIHGLSRRSSIYDHEPAEAMNFEYSSMVRDNVGAANLKVKGGRMPKAKSEAALLGHRNREGTLSPRENRVRHHSRQNTGTSGSRTPQAVRRPNRPQDDWIIRTGAAGNAIVQESKGQSWQSKLPSSTSLGHLQDSTDEDEDDGYEELAALSASTTGLQLADDELSPVQTRSGVWGSRYGSRNGSRLTSRRGSFTGSRTPLAPFTTLGQAEITSEDFPATAVEPDFVDAEEDSEGQDETAGGEGKSYGLGGVVDRIMNFNLFKVEEGYENTDDEGGHASETDAEAAQRMVEESRRRKAEKDKLLNRSGAEGGEQGAAPADDGWSDAAWLLSVASRFVL